MKVHKLIRAYNAFHQRNTTFLFPFIHKDTSINIAVMIKQGIYIRRG